MNYMVYAFVITTTFLCITNLVLLRKYLANMRKQFLRNRLIDSPLPKKIESEIPIPEIPSDKLVMLESLYDYALGRKIEYVYLNMDLEIIEPSIDAFVNHIPSTGAVIRAMTFWPYTIISVSSKGHNAGDVVKLWWHIPKKPSWMGG